jgi:hypothetical protein
MTLQKKRILWLAPLVVVAALLWFLLHRIQFRWAVVAEQLRQADWLLIVAGLATAGSGSCGTRKSCRSSRW